MAWLPPPSAAVLKVAVPLVDNVLAPRTVEKSLKTTEPVGTKEDPELGLVRIVAVKVTVCPNVETTVSEVIAVLVPRTGIAQGSKPSSPSLAAKNRVPLTFVKNRG